ncbi:polysaccharide biosynthesis protein [Priestia aryabhattai]|uniref:polysaccharide biosynthesis protein n=1 Tax=Priestia aryabhattai TaxID=412384 RepID=UPI0024534579|nr:polysaccharide biosynthesis protein [Priestia aryabhattai]MDH3115876.1 polysaccharide biosynthesis protein [Priestia aryabhattai]MDH3125231.1 polysaccharide biosynthesis protein [Priestia aryabhattai]
MIIQEKKKHIINKQNVTLKKNISWSLIGNIIYALSQFGILVGINKFGNVQMVGQYGLGLAITAPLYKFLNMQLSTVQASDSKNEYTFRQYFQTRFFSSLIGLIILAIFCMMDFISVETRLAIFLIGLSKFIETISDVIYGLMQKEENIGLIALSKVLRGVTSVLLFSILLKLTHNLIFAIVGICISWIIVLLAFDCLQLKKLLNKLSVKKPVKNLSIKNLIILSLPLGFAGTIDLLNVNLPRYIIQIKLNENELGYFVSIAYLMVAGGMLIDSVAISIIPRLSKLYITNLDEFKALVKKLVLFGATIGGLGLVISLLMGDFILTFLYNDAYTGYNSLLNVIMLGSAFWYIAGFLNSALSAARIFGVQLKIFIITFLIVFLTSLVLIPHMGILGAGLSLCIGMFTRMILTASTLMHRVKRN